METNYSTMTYDELYKMESDKIKSVHQEIIQSEKANSDFLLTKGIDVSTMDIIQRADFVSNQIMSVIEELAQSEAMIPYTEDTVKLQQEIIKFRTKGYDLASKFMMFSAKENKKIRLDTIRGN